mmetsp:Transcript_55283/g.131844  ORF Transcript_55283/g.131844 Transcript_55283/m.131844 type:complete len:368 (+) Transcript_55283:93-1196(+)
MLSPDVALKLGPFQCFIVCGKVPGLDDSSELALEPDVEDMKMAKKLSSKDGRRFSFARMVTRRSLKKDQATAEALKAAISKGRFIEANEIAAALQASGSSIPNTLGDRGAERLARICKKYQESKEFLHVKVKDLPYNEHNAKLGLDWGFMFKGDKFRLMYTVEHELDIMKSFAAYQEADLSKGYKAALVSAEAVGPQSPNDTIWRCKSASDSLPGLKADSVTIYNFVDALDDDCRSIWFCSYTPPEGSQKNFNGIDIPPVDDKNGYARSSYFFSAALLTPLEEKSSNRVQRFRVTSVNEFQVPQIVLTPIKWTPHSIIAKGSRSNIEDSIVKFRAFVESSPDLDQRLKDSPRAELYQHIWAHLSGKA